MTKETLRNASKSAYFNIVRLSCLVALLPYTQYYNQSINQLLLKFGDLIPIRQIRQTVSTRQSFWFYGSIAMFVSYKWYNI